MVALSVLVGEHIRIRDRNATRAGRNRLNTTVRKDLGELSDIEAVEALVAITGAQLVDVGCGAGASSRALAERGATVLAVEPDPIQAEKNRAAEAVSGVRFAEAGAEALPAEDAAADGVFFFRSLHHVPRERMDDALAEAARVLKPGGFLYVAEPAMTGTHFPVMRPYNDETEVRTLAQAALARAAGGGAGAGADAGDLFETPEMSRYTQHPSYENFEALVARVTGQTFNDISREQVERADVRELFEAGRTADGDYVFEQPMLVTLFRRVPGA